MNRQKLATIGCIILSIVFSVSIGLFIHFKLYMPTVSDVYEKSLYYPEDLYKEYQEEAEKMIFNHEYTCQYPVKTTFYSKNGRTTLIIKVGEYNEGDKGSGRAHYLTATVKNFGTNEQEITFERNIKSAEDAYKIAERYRILTSIFTLVFIGILIIFTADLIKKSIKGLYKKVLIYMLYILVCIVMINTLIHIYIYM